MRWFVRLTSSLAAWHQWLKFPISTQDFAILAWFSTEARALVRCSTQASLRKLVETIGNGCVELPSSQNISLAITAIAPPGRSKKCKKSVRNLRPLFPQVHWTSFYCVIAKVHTAVVLKGE